MAPTATSAARRATAAPQARPASRRPPLRIFEPEPRRSTRRGPSRRAHIWFAVTLVAGSLLVVVVGDAMVAQGQVRMAGIQTKIVALQATQKAMQTEVAQLAAPDRVVAQGIALGLTAPAQVIDLPQVPLNVPLPAPKTTPVAAPVKAAAPASSAPAPTAPTATSSTSASAASPATSGTAPAATTKTSSTAVPAATATATPAR